MSKFQSEFAAHPDAKELYVVNGMPFLEKNLAENFQRGTDHKIEVVTRPNTKPAAPATKAEIIAELIARSIEHDAKAKKADLVALLAAADAASAGDPSDEEE